MEEISQKKKNVNNNIIIQYLDNPHLNSSKKFWIPLPSLEFQNNAEIISFYKWKWLYRFCRFFIKLFYIHEFNFIFPCNPNWYMFLNRESNYYTYCYCCFSPNGKQNLYKNVVKYAQKKKIAHIYFIFLFIYLWQMPLYKKIV